MSRSVLRADLVSAVALAVLVHILAPGLAVVAMVAIVVLASCLISVARGARARRGRPPGRAGRPRRQPGRPQVSARRPARR